MIDSTVDKELAELDLTDILEAPTKSRPRKPQRGQQTKPIEIHSVLDICEADLKDLVVYGAGQPRDYIRDMRSRHHRMAQLLAAGLHPSEVARIVGCTSEQIRILNNSPAFTDLLEHYTVAQARDSFDLHERILGLTEDSLDVLAKLLHDSEEDLTPEFILKCFEKLADRSGYGPTTKSEHREVHAHVTFAELAAIKERANVHQLGRVVDVSDESGTPKKEGQPTLEGRVSEDSGPGVGGADSALGEGPAQSSEVEGDTSPGEGV